MASLESIVLGYEVIRWMSNVRANLRENAEGYKIQAAATGANFTTIGSVMTADAVGLLNTMAAVEPLWSAPTKRAKLVAYFAVFGVTPAEINAVIAELKGAALALRDASKTNKTEIDAAADAVLAAVAVYDLPRRV